MNKYKKLSAMSVAILTLTLMVPAFASASISNEDDNIFVDESAVISTSTDLINGSDDVGGGLVTPGATSTNTGDTLISNGDDDEVFDNEVLSGEISENSTSTPITNGDDDFATTTLVTNGDDDIISTTTTQVATTTPEVTTSTSSGGSTSGSSGYRSVSNPITLTPTSCNYLTSYLKFGSNNDTAQVSKLQSFLKNTEKINVDVNGTFDIKTMNAVKAFQTKYTNEIMAPWGLKDSSGYVYYTTQKKINEIYCKKTFNLTLSQLADIANYKNKNLAVDVIAKPVVKVKTVNVNATSTSTVEESLDSSTTPVMDEEVGSINRENDTQSAAVVNSGFFGKVWKLIKGIF